MADQKISQLSDGGASQATDEYVIARSGANYRIDGASVAAAATSVGTLSSLTVSGDLTVDTNTLKVVASTNRVGIGTLSPGVALDVAGSGRFSGFDSGYYNENVLAIGNASNDPKIGMGSNSGYRWNMRIADVGASNVGNFVIRYEEGSVDALTITRSGNLGLGVTPSAWGSGLKALQVGANSYASLFDFNNGVTFLSSNLFWTGSAYSRISASSRWSFAYSQDTTNGAHTWLTSTAAGTSTPTMSTLMTLDASGNLSLGTTTAGPFSRNINLDGTNSSGILLRVGDVGKAFLYGDSTNAVLGANTGAVIFKPNDTEAARITSGGYFKASDAGTYIGSTGAYHEFRQTATAQASVHVSNTAASPYGVRVDYTGAAPNGTDNWFLYCNDTGGLRAEIRSNGGLRNYQSNNADLSDARTKNSITPAASMWDKVAALEIVTYKYNDQTHDDVNLGVIAQQVETVEPVWVDPDGFGETPEGEEPLKTVYTKDITFASIKALQEAMARIEALEARLEALEA